MLWAVVGAGAVFGGPRQFGSSGLSDGFRIIAVTVAGSGLSGRSVIPSQRYDVQVTL